MEILGEMLYIGPQGKNSRGVNSITKMSWYNWDTNNSNLALTIRIDIDKNQVKVKKPFFFRGKKI